MRCLTPRTALSLLASLVICLSTARADYHYASHTGSNQYPYNSWQTAADSIQKAINAASPHDTVYVGAGVWEDAPCTLWQDLSLLGRGIDSTIMQKGYHSGRLRFIQAQSHVIIEGITFDGVNSSNNNCGFEGFYGAADIMIFNNKFVNLSTGILEGGSTGRISNNVFVYSRIAIDGSFDACSLLVKNNTFENNSAYCLVAYNGNWTIVQNVFCHNPTTSLRLVVANVNRPVDSAYIGDNLFYDNYGGVSWDRCDLINCGPRAYLENNTIVGLPGPRRFVAVLITSSDTMRDLNNNIISDFYSPVHAYYDSTVARLAYNDLWDISSLSYGGGQVDTAVGNIQVDPMFFNSTDFHLQMYSPLIDAGDPNILDVDGSRSDIGCYGGPGGESYSYLDLPPRMPDSLRATVEGDTVLITWRYNTEADFDRYRIYRDTVPGFEPGVFNLIAEAEYSLFFDPDLDMAHNYYYRIAAADYQDNVSPYSEELAVIFTGVNDFGDPNVPRLTRIETNYPNPFNTRTIISYYLADIGFQPAEVQLYIYNVGGQLVRRLVEARQYPGRYSVSWDGRDEGGQEVSSGVYFSRLTVSGLELSKPRKILLVK